MPQETQLELAIFLAALIAALLLVIEHYVPWFRAINHGKLHPIANYVLGCLALFVPYSALLVVWDHLGIFTPWVAVIALWIISISGGVAVVACYAADRYIERGQRVNDAEARETRLRQALKEGQDIH